MPGNTALPREMHSRWNATAKVRPRFKTRENCKSILNLSRGLSEVSVFFMRCREQRNRQLMLLELARYRDIGVASNALPRLPGRNLGRCIMSYNVEGYANGPE